MEMKKETSTGITIAAILLVLVGFYIYQNKGRENNNTPENSATSTTATTTNTPGYTIEEVSATQTTPAPSLTRAIVYPASFTEVQKKAIETNINGNIALINKNPKDVDAWIALGINRKMITDYVGTEEVWKYAEKLAPKYIVPVQNLADLYHYYLKNYSQSEVYWKKAIALDIKNPDLYKGLFDLYALSYKEKASLAEPTLLEGIKQNPKNIDLMVYLAEYYKNTGRKEDARTYYTKAHDEATSMGDTKRAILITEEITAL